MHPTLVAANFAHWGAKERDYKPMFDLFAMNLERDVTHVQANDLEFVIGTDEEPALMKSLDKSFNNPIHIICYRHVQSNLMDHLKDQGTPDHIRDNIKDAIFESGGLVDAKSSVEFLSSFDDFEKLYGQYLSPRNLKTLKEKMWHRMVDPKLKVPSIDDRFKTNRSECMHGVLKGLINHEPQDIDKFVNITTKFMDCELEDVRRSLYGQGRYELTEEYQKFLVTRERWIGWTPEERQSHFLQFANAGMTKKDPDFVTSKCGKMTVQQKKTMEKKSNQKKGPKSHRTNSAKRKREELKDKGKDLKSKEESKGIANEVDDMFLSLVKKGKKMKDNKVRSPLPSKEKGGHKRETAIYVSSGAEGFVTDPTQDILKALRGGVPLDPNNPNIDPFQNDYSDASLSSASSKKSDSPHPSLEGIVYMEIYTISNTGSTERLKIITLRLKYSNACSIQGAH